MTDQDNENVEQQAPVLSLPRLGREGEEREGAGNRHPSGRQRGGDRAIAVLTMFRRLLLLLALMFWQGGFMFYGAVVVPVGAEVLGSHRQQGFVTQSVTNYLNVAGAVALAVWCWDIAAGHAAGGRRLRWIGWGLLVVLLSVLVRLHPRLDELLNADGFRILDRPGYRSLHQWYLTVSTIQWIVAIVLIGLTIWKWKECDTAAGRQPIKPGR